MEDAQKPQNTDEVQFSRIEKVFLYIFSYQTYGKYVDACDKYMSVCQNIVPDDMTFREFFKITALKIKNPELEALLEKQDECNAFVK